MKGINLFLADGFEDVEALATNDILRRAGLKTNLIAISDEPFVSSSHGVTIGAEWNLPEIELDHAGTDRRDVMIFPGGMPGSKKLASCKPLMKAMKEHYAAGGTVAAICAAPGLVLPQLGPEALKGVEFTCFDGFEPSLQDQGAVFNPVPAVRSGRIITGRSAGHAPAFAFEILDFICPEKAADVYKALYLYEK